MYIRNLRKPSPNKNVFKFASAKVSDVIMCESSLEFDACFHHEYNDEIESYGSQPKGFKYDFNGKVLPYTPDTIIRYIDGTEKYHEYKYKEDSSSVIFKEKFKARRSASLALGIELILVTEKQIRVNPILNNLKLVHRYSGVYGINGIQQSLLKFIHSSGIIRFDDVRRELNLPIGVARSFLFSLIHKGFIKTDLDVEDLTVNPMLWSAKNV